MCVLVADAVDGPRDSPFVARSAAPPPLGHVSQSRSRVLAYGDREFGAEITDPRQDAMTQDWHCTYRVAGTRTHRVRGPDRLSAVYAALTDIHSATTRFGSHDNTDDPHRPREPVAARPRIGGATAANAREFGPPLGARAVDTAAGPVVIVLVAPAETHTAPTLACAPSA